MNDIIKRSMTNDVNNNMNEYLNENSNNNFFDQLNDINYINSLFRHKNNINNDVNNQYIDLNMNTDDILRQTAEN